jgi:type VI secretion system FHA domain protein
MQLRVDVLKYKGQALPRPLSAVFDRQGGILGRFPENHLVLPDPEKYISRKHAVILYEKGLYYLKDRSKEGTFVSNKNLHVFRDKVSLADGDRLRIGDYDILVSIIQHTPTSSDKDESENSDPIELLKPLRRPEFEQPDDEAGVSDPEKSLPEYHNSKSSDPIDLLKSISESEGHKSPTAPEDAELKVMPKVPQNSQRDLFSMFLDGAGINDRSFFKNDEAPEIMRNIGVVMRACIDGLITLLHGRTELKGQCRVPLTVLRRSENNPLKFFRTADEAMTVMLTQKDPGYISAVEAVRQGYDDIKDHQLAVMAGIKSSLLAIIKRFEPEQVAHRYAEGVVFQKSAKCWEAYTQTYRKIAQDALDNFFGEEFTREYEAQIRKIRS